MRKLYQTFVLLAAVLLACYSANLRADDIDVYVDNSSNNAVPNVLFVIDTGANFSASATPCTYASGGSPSLGSTAGGVEQCALVNAIEALPNGTVNIGILVNNNNNFATDTHTTGKAAHETCSGTYGGCVVRKLALMDAAGKTSLINFIKSWSSSGQDSADVINIKSGGDRTANMMQEAWAYYNGKTGMSGKSYGTSLLAGGCQRNFVVFIGNSFTNSGTPGDGGSADPGAALAESQVGASAAQKAVISEPVNFSSAICGATTVASSVYSGNWADEWARLMYQQDGGNAAATGSVQNIITYGIGVVSPDGSCKPEYPALLSQMAKYGGGKFFSTSNSADLTTALAQILNEVQAVNSVFSSASLPVSVNAQGTYLNQIFLGMFRPDAGGNPRWMGNLKQFQLVPNASGALVLGDANGNSAISSAGTGFITPTAVSYWTYKNTAVEPDAGGGFFRNDAKGTPNTTFDSPDGEVVEKGGVAQQLRKENLTATFSGAATAVGTSTNPRRLYTYCPSGSGCVAALNNAANEFSTNNGDISASAFGTSTGIGIASITRSGPLATVTTTGNHGMSGTLTVSISNANQPEYNGTKTATVTGLKTLTFPVADYPTTPATGSYTVSIAGGTPIRITSMTKTSSGGGSETVTVTTQDPHTFTTASNIVISGVTPNVYNFAGKPASATPGTNTFTFTLQNSPPLTASTGYTIAFAPGGSNPSANITNASKSGGNFPVTANNTFWGGMPVVISGATGGSAANWNKSFIVQSSPAPTGSTFYVNNSGNPGTVTNGTATPDPTARDITSITRSGTTATGTLGAGFANYFGNAVGKKRIVNITKKAGSAAALANETGYELTNVEITCTNATCTTFTFPVTVTPDSTPVSGTDMMVGLQGANGVITSLTRSGSTATANITMNAGVFTNGQSVTISAVGTGPATEAAYTGNWTISCASCSTSFTFGPVTLTPTTPATGNNMQLYAAGSSPDRDTVIKWVRGLDSQGDENSPGGTIKVRESIHGDVLHSRPTVINYGDSRGIVVFYGANDGVFRAVNGNQSGNISDVPPGGELWGLVLPEHYPFLYRQMVNSPELRFPSTFLTTAQSKDYFVDGPTGAYQKLNEDGTIASAYLFLTMRRGGRFIYAVDVTNPTAPVFLWKKSFTDVGFSELGQTWSRPRLTLLQGINDPVLVFGAGYDPNQDSEPPSSADTMGRGVFVLNATTGDLVWSASPSCGTSTATCKQVDAMTFSIPSEIAFVDRDANGKTDKFYFGDMGGNVWRADVNDANTANWTVTKLAALGCDTGVCASGTTPRKFFFPPDVLTLRASGAVNSYDAISIASGDREHPLKSTAAGSSYGVTDRFFMLKDTGTSLGTPTTSNLVLSNLMNATSTPYNGTVNGFYITFATGEKSVNAPTSLNGFVFFATNRPIDRSITCAANLGEAKAYAVSPFDATTTTNTLAGGGMPPSAVTGLVNITKTNADGTTTSSVQKFCIGCGISGSQLGGTNTGACNSALENCNIGKVIPKNLKRTYWYKK